MSDSDYEASYEYLCRTCGHHERKHAGYPLACVVCDSHNLLRTPLFREPKPGEYDFWARDQHIEVLKAEVERLRAENAALAGEREAVEKLLLDNGYGGAGFASLADAIDATLGELWRLEAKSKALRAECGDLWEVIERTKDALRDYDGICLEGAQGAWEILQGALDEEPTDDE